MYYFLTPISAISLSSVTRLQRVKDGVRDGRVLPLVIKTPMESVMDSFMQASDLLDSRN